MRRLFLWTFAAGLTACSGDPVAGTGASSTTTSTPEDPTTTDAPTTGPIDPPTTEPSPPSTTTTTSDSPTTTTSDPSSTGEPTACTADPQPLRMRRASVVLVLEKSVTMTSDQHYWDHDSDPNTARVPLWLSVHAAVHEVLSDLEDRVDLGAELFPSAEATNMYDATACAYDPEISVPVAALHHDEILAAMPPANAKLRGAYPVTAALEIAYDHLHSRESDEPKLAIAVLRSLPACRADAPDSTSLFESYDGSAEPTVVTARYTGIRTHFIALDASDENTGSVNDAQPDDVVPTEVFAALASAGGTPVNNARDQAQLAAALREILESLPEPSCVLQLDRALQSDDGAVVRVDGVDVPRADDCAAEQGWRFTTAAPPFTAIELCEATCTSLRRSGVAELVDCVNVPQ